MTFISEAILLNPLSHNQHHCHYQHHQVRENTNKMIIQQQQQQQQQQQPLQRHQHQLNQAPQKCSHQSTTNNAIDPVYLEDDEVFYNLILKESSEQNCKQSTRCQAAGQRQLVGQQRHLLLSWMLRVCEHEYCEDDIFSLATMILDKFLIFRPLSNETTDTSKRLGAGQDSRAFSRRRRLRIKKVRKKAHMMDFYKQQQQQQEVEHDQFYCNEYNNSSNISMTTEETIQAQDGGKNHFDNTKTISSSSSSSGSSCREDTEEEDEDEDEEEIIDYDVRDEELRQRQLYLFAACSLLLASKLRQTPRLCIQILIEFSKLELPIELTRDEILDGELLILSSLKWDLGALVTPNDFLNLILRKCNTLLEPFSIAHNRRRRQHHQPHYRRPLSSPSDDDDDDDDLDHELGARTSLIGRETTTTTTTTTTTITGAAASLETPSALITPSSTPDEMIEQPARQRRLAKCDEFKVKRHTQTLLELCLMDSQLSQYSPSILAMACMAVAIDGLSAGGRICARLNDILVQVHEATHKVNELKLMIDVAHQIEKYVQKLLNSTRND